MAWRNLNEFIHTELNNKIPLTATCRIIAGNGNKKSRHKKNGLKILTKKNRKLLEENDNQEITIGDFLNKFSMFVNEWSITPEGHFVHYRGPYQKKKDKIVWYTIIQLDLTEWFLKQSPELLLERTGRNFLQTLKFGNS